MHSKLFAALPVLISCAPAPGEKMPDFSLVDINTASASYNTPISPRDSLDLPSAWYFGHTG